MGRARYNRTFSDQNADHLFGHESHRLSIVSYHAWTESPTALTGEEGEKKGRQPVRKGGEGNGGEREGEGNG